MILQLTLEIKSLIEDNRNLEPLERYQETIVLSRYLKSSEDGRFKKIVEEDLADLNCITEKSILELLQERFKNGNTYTFAGDILISLSVNGKVTGNYGPEVITTLKSSKDLDRVISDSQEIPFKVSIRKCSTYLRFS